MNAIVKKDGLLAGKVAVVTGASRGIGEAIALRYAMEGAKVVVSARTVGKGDNPLGGSINEVVECIQAAGGEAFAVRADLAVAEHRENLIKQAEEKYGQVDILVNNAAITYFMSVLDFTHKRYQLMMEVQLYGAFHLAQLVLPGMIARKSGRILSVSSHAAIHPAKDSAAWGSTVYGMCKIALERFTTGLASEVYADGIGVNVISPGLVATPGVVHHKLITEDTPPESVTPVEHMAEACLRLVYGDSKEMTGIIGYADEIMKEYSLTAATLLD
ncbi:MAG: SDR family NAD(P)-dependent oxidoreductase [Pseudomonadales bacterium]|nr:SDR family NAD(P)-dependent oxidoreductase [Pseudomonadales bacterium]